MTKILMGLAAAIVVALGGYFGFQFYVQHRVAGEVESAFTQIRDGGGKASHGNISFDAGSRTVEIADIAVESATQPPFSIKIAKLALKNVAQPDAARFSAETIEASGLDIGAALPGPAGSRLSYKMPLVTVKDYSGPIALPARPASATIIDTYRIGIEQFAAITASSVRAPGVTLAVDAGPVMSASYVYDGLTIQDIKDGKVAVMKVDRATINVNMQQAGKTQKVTGELAGMAAYDFDAKAIAAILDPRKANDDTDYPVYRQLIAGPYSISTDPGVHFQIGGFEVDDVAVRPSRLQIAPLLAMIPAAGTSPVLSPAQAGEIIGKMASIYEGMRIGNAEMHGLTADTPQGKFALSAVHFNLVDGKFGEFALEGVDTQLATGPVKLGRFALKSFDIANLLRMSALFSNPTQKPPPEQVAKIMTLLTGVEVKGFVSPFKNTGKAVTVDAFDFDWGQFVGPIPTKLHLATRMSAPVDGSDPKMQLLLAAGLDTLAADCDISLVWAEAPHTLVLDAPAFNIDGVLKASARVSLGNVTRQMLSIDPQRAAALMVQTEAGTIELTVRDAGGVDLLMKQLARLQNIDPEAARQALTDSIRATAANTGNPATIALGDALIHFLETPKTALTLKLTPRGKVPTIRLIQAWRADPATTLDQFQVDVSTAQ